MSGTKIINTKNCQYKELSTQKQAQKLSKNTKNQA